MLFDINAHTVIVSAPVFPALTQEDLNNALGYAGLRSWLTLPIPYLQRLSESKAGFGAKGFGLCENYKDLYDCQDEYEELPSEVVYFISLTRQALYASLDRYQAAFDFGSETKLYIFNQKAGIDNLPESPSPATFWSYVGTQLKLLIQQPRQFPTKILLAGENATNPSFLHTFRDILESIRLQGRLQNGNTHIDLLGTASHSGAEPMLWQQGVLPSMLVGGKRPCLIV